MMIKEKFYGFTQRIIKRKKEDFTKEYRLFSDPNRLKKLINKIYELEKRFDNGESIDKQEIDGVLNQCANVDIEARMIQSLTPIGRQELTKFVEWFERQIQIIQNDLNDNTKFMLVDNKYKKIIDVENV